MKEIKFKENEIEVLKFILKHFPKMMEEDVRRGQVYIGFNKLKKSSEKILKKIEKVQNDKRRTET